MPQWTCAYKPIRGASARHCLLNSAGRSRPIGKIDALLEGKHVKQRQRIGNVLDQHAGLVTQMNGMQLERSAVLLDLGWS